MDAAAGRRRNETGLTAWCQMRVQCISATFETLLALRIAAKVAARCCLVMFTNAWWHCVFLLPCMPHPDHTFVHLMWLTSALTTLAEPCTCTSTSHCARLILSILRAHLPNTRLPISSLASLKALQTDAHRRRSHPLRCDVLLHACPSAIHTQKLVRSALLQLSWS